MSLLDRINKAIDLDYDSKNKEISDLTSIPLEERILKGDTISNLRANFTTEYVNNKKIYFKKVTVYCNRNNSKFRIGSPVVLCRHDYSFKLEVIEEQDNSLVLYEDYQTYIVPQDLNNSDDWHLNPASVDIRNIVKGATSILQSNPIKFNHLKNIFDGKVLPDINPQLYEQYKGIIKKSKLNEMQREAFSKSLSAKNYFLIQGPPGTGKTYVLAHIAHQLALEGKKVLITAFNYSQGIMLDTTYRMNESIAAFPSKQFYNNKLESDISIKNSILNISSPFSKYSNILDASKPEVLVCHSTVEEYPRSPFEAKVISELVKGYLQKGIKTSSIAIITPIRAQVREIFNTFSQDNYLKPHLSNIFIDTVEQIQGQERDIVIFSLSISDPIKAKQRVEFFLNPNRLNVALTRSRLKRIVIGHKSLFFLNSYDPNIKSLIKNYRDFYNDSYKVEL